MHRPAIGSPGTALVLVAILALAGCNGLGGARETVTPVATGDGTGPPGISNGGVDGRSLADAHAAALSRTNYTVVVTERIERGNETLRNTTFRRYVAAGAARYELSRTQVTRGMPSTALDPRMDFWYDGTETRFRLGGAPDPRYGRSPASGPGPIPDPSNHERIGAALDAFDQRVTALPNGSYRIASTGVTDSGAVPTPTYVGRPRNASTRTLVGPGGVVRHHRLAYDASFSAGEGPVHVERTVRVFAVGETRVEPPAWTAAVPEPDG